MTTPTLSSAGRRALGIVGTPGGITLDRFVVAYWSEQEVAKKLRAGKLILEQLVDQGLVTESINLGRHGPIYSITREGSAALP